MAKRNPKSNMETLERTVAALRELAPDAKFGGITLAELEADTETCREDRTAIINHDTLGKSLDVKRDTDDEIALAKVELVVNGVVGDPKYGPDSALYEALGYVRKSERKSGLTRKKSEPK